MILCKKEKLNKYYINYISSEYNDDLYCCYKKPSQYKLSAMHNLKVRLSQEYNCKRFKILSFNTDIFTVGCIGQINGQDIFVYITPNYIRYMYLYE